MFQEQTKIPTLLALIVVAALSVGGLFAYERVSSFLSATQTLPNISPQDVRFTNHTDSSVVISWKTDEPIAATVRYGTNNPDKTAYDIRDNDQLPKPYRLHYVELSDLPPNSPIAIEIVHNEQSHPLEPYTSAPTIAHAPQILPIYGELTSNVEDFQTGAVVYAQLNDQVVWSTFISNTTSWVIPIASIRTADLTQYYCDAHACNSDTPIEITAVTPEGSTTTSATLDTARPLREPLEIGRSVGSTEISPSPTPHMDNEATLSATITPSVEGTRTEIASLAPATPTPTPTPQTFSAQLHEEVSILNPKQGVKLRFTKPLIRGQGIPGKQVHITLNSAVQQVGTVVVQDTGIWLWTPKLPLEPGNHTLSIRTVDANDTPITLSRSFSIFKSGEQVLSSSTPSADLSTPTPTPTEAEPIVPTSTPIVATPTPVPDMPVSASFLPSITLLAGGVLLLILGFALI